MVGGTFDSAIDAGESVLFTLDLAATGVSCFVQFARDEDGDGQYGETEVEGYGADEAWLGTVTLDGIGAFVGRHPRLALAAHFDVRATSVVALRSPHPGNEPVEREGGIDMLKRHGIRELRRTGQPSGPCK